MTFKTLSLPTLLAARWKALQIPTRWLLAGLAVRLLIAPFTYARDFWWFIRAADYTVANPHNLIDLSYWNYPPPHLWVITFLLMLWSILPVNHDLLVSGTALPLNQWYVPYPIHDFLVNPLLVAMFKAPMILADVATGIVLFRGVLSLGLSQSRARLAFKIWMLNPIVIWISTASGHFDIIPTFFALYALTSALNGRFRRASLSLGLGGVWKLWPFLLLPVLLQFSRKQRNNTLLSILRRYSQIISVTFIPIIIVTALYFLFSSPETFRAYSPIEQPTGYGVLLGYMIPIPANPFGEIPLTLTTLVVLTTIIMVTNYDISAEIANGLILVLLLTILTLSPISTQYLMWPLPFLLLDWILARERLWFFTTVSAIMFGFLMLRLDALGFGFYFSAIIPEGVYSYLTALSTDFTVLSVLRSIFLGVTIFYAFTIISLMRGKRQVS